MKKSNYGKKYLFSRKNITHNEKLAFFVCIPITAISLMMCAIIVLIPKTNTTIQEPHQNIIEETEKVTYSPTSPSSIEFQSFENKTCSVVGIGTFEGKELKIPERSPDGDTVIAINSNAFKGCENLELVSIPQTVEMIGKNAFEACPSLAYIDVDMNNKYYSSINGVLFSKSKDTLVKYPSNKSSEKYYLDSNTKNIEDNAFENIKNLSYLLYSKNSEDFEKIHIGEGNEALEMISISCNYKGQSNSK